MSAGLLPCPFCGSPAELVAGNGYPGEKVVRCMGEDCRAEVAEIFGPGGASASDLWNKRIADARMHTLLERWEAEREIQSHGYGAALEQCITELRALTGTPQPGGDGKEQG